MSATVFLGGGRITAALVAGLHGAGHRGRIVVFDRNSQKLRQLKRQFGVETTDDLRWAAEQASRGGRRGHPGMLLVAVRPGDALPLLAQLRPVPPRTLVVSLAAGIRLRELRGTLGPRVEWARAMPSPAARAGLGLTALAFDRMMRPAGRRQVRRLCQQVGSILEIPEEQFDAFTVTYSTSQGCGALLTRIRAARKIGLDAKTAFAAAAHALADGIRALGDNPAALPESLKEAATPGGIAARVLETMHTAGYERVVDRAFRAGLAQARGIKRRRTRA